MAGSVVHLDFETRSAVDLKKAGAYRYAEDPTTEIVCLSYRMDDGPVRRWKPGETFPTEIYEHADRLVAHNAGFERAIWNAKLAGRDTERGRIARLDPPWQDCTMARGLAMGLPAALFMLGRALGIEEGKDMMGHKLMMQMCKPRSIEPLIWWDEPEKIERLQEYCDRDVLSECQIDAKLPPLSDRERRVWVLDQTINDRGVRIDVEMVRRALTVVELALDQANAEMWRLTNGAVKKATETAKIVDWLCARGIKCESVAKGEIDELVLTAQIVDDATAEIVIRLRRATARTSTSKLKAMLDTVCADGRVRGSLAYHGASTGRWAGRLIQPQNFPRLSDEDEVSRDLALRILDGAMSPADQLGRIDLVCGPPMEVLSKCLRAMIVAPAGKKLIGGDFSNIEGRVNAWLAGATWKLDAFCDYDAGSGPDLYRVGAGRILGVGPEAVTKKQRQDYGKVPELACGYQGGVGAFQTMAANSDVRVTDDEARGIVKAWREANPEIVQSWWDLQNAAIEAIEAPGCIVPVLGGRVRYVVQNGFLFCRLPSSRVLAYASPKVVWKEVARDDGTTFSTRSIQYMGVDSLTKKWSPQDLYGGALCDHIVQGTSRDILVEAMFAVEAAGYPIVLTVHDELLCEVDRDFGSPVEFEALMLKPILWLDGCPIAATTWEGARYVK